MQFLSENRLNGCQIFGRFSTVRFLKTESEPNFGFPHIPNLDPVALRHKGSGVLYRLVDRIKVCQHIYLRLPCVHCTGWLVGVKLHFRHKAISCHQHFKYVV